MNDQEYWDRIDLALRRAGKDSEARHWARLRLKHDLWTAQQRERRDRNLARRRDVGDLFGWVVLFALLVTVGSVVDRVSDWELYYEQKYERLR